MRNLVYMVNKREKTRSLVYQMKEDIFRQEAALAELEHKETTVIPLPKFCHNSTGTVYDEPAGILRTAQLFEEQGLMLDRKNSLFLASSQKSSPLQQYKTRRASEVSPTRSRRNRQNARAALSDVNSFISSPAASHSPIQQLFCDTIESLESAASWAAASLDVSNGHSTGETSREMLESLALCSELLNTVAVPSPLSPTLTPSSNGFVKIPQYADDEKHSDSQPFSTDSEAQVGKSPSVEHMPLVDATQRSANTALAESPVTPGIDDISKTSDQVIISRDSKCRKARARDVENVERVRVRASRSDDRKVRDTVNVDQLEESPNVSNRNADSKPKTRSQLSKEQIGAEKVTEELNSGLTEKSGMLRSVRKTRSSLCVCDDGDDLTERPIASKSADVLREQPSASQFSDIVMEQSVTSKSSLVDSKKARGRPRKHGKILTEGAPASKTGSALQQETCREEQEMPLQDSSASKENFVLDSSSSQIGSSNLEAGDSTNSARLATVDSETGKEPQFRSYNFRLVESDLSQTSDDQNQSVMLDSTEFSGSHSQQLTAVEPPHVDAAASMDETRVLVDSGSTVRPRPVNSPKHQESEHMPHVFDTLSAKAPLSQSEKKSARGTALPEIPSLWSVSDTLLSRSPSSQSEHVREPTPSTFVPETLLSRPPENVKKRKTLSSGRSRLSTLPGLCGESTPKEFSDDTGKHSTTSTQEVLASADTNSDGGKMKPVSQRRRKIRGVGVSATSVKEYSESHATKQTYNNALQDTTSQISTSNSITDLPIAVSTETSVSSISPSVISVRSDTSVVSAISQSSESTPLSSAAETESHVELNRTLPSDDLLLGTSAKRRSDASDVDNLVTSPRNRPPNLSAVAAHGSTTTSFRTVDTGTTLPANLGLKSGLSAIGSQLSDLAAKTSTASSRKRAAQLMAGCRPRTVGVKRPMPTVEDSISDQPISHCYDSLGRPPTSKRLAFNHTHPPIAQSVGAETSKHAFFCNSSMSQLAATLTDFGPIRAARRMARLNSSDVCDVSEEMKPAPQNQQLVPEISLRKEENMAVTHERPQLMRYDCSGVGNSQSLLSAPESRTLTSAQPTVKDASKDSRHEAVRAELLRKFLPSQLIVTDVIKRKVQDGLRLLSTIRSAPTICSHTRQKLVDYLNQSRKEATQTTIERLPLRSIDEKHDEATESSFQHRVPVQSCHRPVHSEREFVAGVESPPIDAEPDYFIDVEDSSVKKSSQSLFRTQDGRIST